MNALAQPADLDVDTQPILQRLISASGAPRPQTTGVSSVFAMGGIAEPQSRAAEMPRRQRGIRGMAARCVQVLDSCGPLTVAQLAEATGIACKQVRDVCVNGVSRGYLGRAVNAEGRKLYSALAGAIDRVHPDARAEQPTTGFKRWLQKKGQSSAEGRVVKQAHTLQTATAPSTARTAAVQSSLSPRFGLFSDGALRIEKPGCQPLELNSADAKALCAFLAVGQA